MIKKFIDSLASDKKDHIILGLIVGFGCIVPGYLIEYFMKVEYFALIGGAFGIILVGAKEVIHDWLLGKGNPEWWDFIASAVPILMMMITFVMATSLS